MDPAHSYLELVVGRITQEVHVSYTTKGDHLAGERINCLPCAVHHAKSFHHAKLRRLHYVVPGVRKYHKRLSITQIT